MHQPSEHHASPHAEWILWQLVDSAFPSGGFAHSGGVEAAWQHGEIASREEFTDFLAAMLVQAARSAVPFALACHAKPETFDAVAGVCDAFLANHVAKRASLAQGQAMLNAAGMIFPQPVFKLSRQRWREQQIPCHWAPVLGWTVRQLDLPREAAARLTLFWTLRGLISSAVRLSILGPLEGQALQHQLIPFAAAQAQRSLQWTLEDIAQTAPLPDLLQARHDALYSRLFQT